jgi:hypothetical protein
MAGLPNNMTALVVGKDAEAAAELLKALAVEVKFPASEIVPSVLKGVQSLSEDSFSVCFVEDSFPMGELEMFFKDLKGMGKLDSCVFVQVRTTLAPDAHRGSLQHMGFATIISSKGTDADREALVKALKSCFHEREVKVRKVDVSAIMDKLLRKIDQAADDVRRGRDVKNLDVIPAELVELHTEFDPEVLAGYYASLEEATEKAKPIEIEHLEVPEPILGKNLPGLSKKTYVGASHRVWDKLAKKHGKKFKKTKG